MKNTLLSLVRKSEENYTFNDLLDYCFVTVLCYIYMNNTDVTLQKTLKSVEAAEKRKSLLKILEESKVRKKENPLFEKNSKKRKEEFSDSDSDDGAVVPKKIHEDLEKKYHFVKKQKHQLQEELAECNQR